MTAERKGRLCAIPSTSKASSAFLIPSIAAARLGAQVQAPPQYWRSQPAEHKALFAGARVGQR